MSTPQCSSPALLRVEALGSHVYRPLDRQIQEEADTWAFMAWHTGMQVQPVPGAR